MQNGKLEKWESSHETIINDYHGENQSPVAFILIKIVGLWVFVPILGRSAIYIIS